MEERGDLTNQNQKWNEEATGRARAEGQREERRNASFARERLRGEREVELRRKVGEPERY